MKKSILILLVVCCLLLVSCVRSGINGQTTDSELSSTEAKAEVGGVTEDSANGDTIDDSIPSLVLSSTSTNLKSGDEFTLTIEMKNNPGIFALTLELPIDSSVFEFVSSDTKQSICPWLGICNYDESSSIYKFNGYNTSPVENLNDNGILVTVTLKVKESAKAGEYSFFANPDSRNIINVDAEEVAFERAHISVKVSK